MEYNLDNLEDLIKLADSFDSGIMLMYQLVPVGRGCAIKDAALDLNTNERLVRHVSEQQKEVSVLIESVAAPQYWVYLLEKNKKNKGVAFNLSKKVFHGCTAGRGLMYIKPNGAVWPCPFVEIEAGNAREIPIDVIWRESEIFKNLRNRESLLKGKCGDCQYNRICGGCRGRAYALTGDYLEEDKFCFIKK
jgi:radical SAM protein with 4Fe4S-binding SPASM domain